MDISVLFFYLMLVGFTTPFFLMGAFYIYEKLNEENYYINGQRNPPNLPPAYVRVESEDEFDV